MSKTKELTKLIKEVNKLADKKFGNIKSANEETVFQFIRLMKNVFEKAPDYKDENIHQKAVEAFILFRESNMPKNMFNEYAEKELDYLIDFIKLTINELKK
nr:MAG: hypothetical protein [uncultured archaeon]